MNRRAPRRGLSVLAAGVAASAVLLPTVLLSSAQVVPAHAADAPEAATISVATFAPDVAKPGGTLRLTGSVRAGAEEVPAAVVRVRVGQTSIPLRDSLSAVASGRVAANTVPVAVTPAADLAAGASRAWSLSAPLDPLGLTVAGAYPVVVELSSAETGLTAAHVTSFLSWFPDGTAATPTRVVWTVPLIGTPARDADGVYLDDRTAASIAPGGRLRSLLDAAGGTPASWVVDPELLESVRDMSDGYQVRTEDGRIEAGGAAGVTAAQRFLADVRARLAEADVSSLGYADPDVNALQRGGLERDITLSTTRGAPLAASLLGRQVRGSLAWPPGDAAEKATLSTLHAAGITTVVLADSALRIDPSVTYTPTGLVRLGVSDGTMTGVLSDATLDAVVGDPALSGGDALARARYLAETLVITQQRPSESRSIVVAPPRMWDVDTAFARNLLTISTNRVPWLQPSSVTQLLRRTPPTLPRSPLTYGDAERKAELSRAQVDGARALSEGISTFTGVLADPAATGARYTGAAIRTESAAFRTQRTRGTALLEATTGNLERDRAKVHVLSRGTVRLSGAKGQVPITVANDLDQSVVVRVRLVPSSSVKLRVDQPGVIRLGPHKKETVDVDAKAATSGNVPVDVVLLTQDGERYAEPITIQVRSTAYSRVGLVIVVVALVALLILVAARLVRRARASGDRPDDGPTATPSTAGGDDR